MSKRTDKRLVDALPRADEGVVKAAWSNEIERRAREALADAEDDVAWEAVRAELLAESSRGSRDPLR